MATLIPAPKSPVTLKAEVVTHVSVDYNDLERFIHKVTGVEYEMCCYEEWSNDSQHEINVDGVVDEYRDKAVAAFLAGKPQNYSLRAILNALARDGHLPKGSYLIKVSW